MTKKQKNRQHIPYSFVKNFKHAHNLLTFTTMQQFVFVIFSYLLTCALTWEIKAAELEFRISAYKAHNKLESHMLDTSELVSLVFLLVIQVRHVFTILTVSEESYISPKAKFQFFFLDPPLWAHNASNMRQAFRSSFIFHRAEWRLKNSGSCTDGQQACQLRKSVHG